MNFVFNNPTNLIFGCGKVNVVGEEAKKYGKKALIITGASSTKKSGLLAKVQNILANEGIENVVVDNIPQNPTTDSVMQAAKIARENNCDIVIGLGGGSSIDASKAIACMSVSDGHVNDYLLGKRPMSGKSLPVIAIPTTCGTGSEADCFAVLNDSETNDKRSLREWATLPKASIVDPEVMMTMPITVLRSVMFDAFCHNVEGYLSRKASPITDMFTLKGIELFVNNVEKILANPKDVDAWNAICLASTFGGFSLQSAGAVALHAVEHPVSGLHNVIHGKGLAALFNVVMEKTLPHFPEKFATLSRILGGKDEHDFLDQVNKYKKILELDISLRDLGVKESDLDWLAENALQVSQTLLSNNPIVFTKTEIREMYQKAF